jgi:hypothetical protein
MHELVCVECDSVTQHTQSVAGPHQLSVGHSTHELDARTSLCRGQALTSYSTRGHQYILTVGELAAVGASSCQRPRNINLFIALIKQFNALIKMFKPLLICASVGACDQNKKKRNTARRRSRVEATE